MRKFKVVDRCWDENDKPVDRVFEVMAGMFEIEHGALVFYRNGFRVRAFRTFDYVEEVE